MSKKTKGQKLDTSIFFQNSSTAVSVSDTPTTEGYGGRPRYDTNDSSRDYNGRGGGSRFSGGESEINWRRPTTIIPPPNASSNPDSKSSDKWESAFTKGSAGKVGASWKKPSDELTARPENDKWSSSFAKGGQNAPQSERTTSEPVKTDNAKMINFVDSVSKKLQHASISDAPATSSVAKPKSSKDNQKKVKQEAAKKLKSVKETMAAKVLALRKQAESIESSTYDIATSSIATGLKGDALLDHIKSLETKPSGSALFKAVLLSNNDNLSVEWTQLNEYGTALKSLLRGDAQGQILSLYALQSYCHKLNFPKLKDSQKNLIAHLMEKIYQYDIIDHKAFIEWSDDDQEVEGKQSALIQSLAFMQILTAESESEGEEVEDDDIDSPLPTVP